jgi:hypothetical protein
VPQAKCSVDGVPLHGKGCSVYWAWKWPTGDRRAYKQLRCVEHSASIALMCARAAQNVATCTHCFKPFEPEEPSVTVWATVYFPHRERIDAYADFHARCFEEAEESLRVGARRLPDRGSGRGAPRPDLEPDPWTALGIDALEST